MKQLLFSLSALLFLFVFFSLPVFAQFNGGFEEWLSTHPHTYHDEMVNEFHVPDPLGGTVKNWSPAAGFGICRTTDSHSGDFALIVHNWYSEVNETIEYYDTINTKPKYLQGYFKYISSNPASKGTVNVTLVKTLSFHTDTIATGTFYFDPAGSYIPFQVVLNYTSEETPNMMDISIVNSDMMCGATSVCDLLYLDDLTLSDITLAVENINTGESALSVYPNPFSSVATIEIKDIRITAGSLSLFNIMGQQVMQVEIKNLKTIISREGLPAGVYFYKLNNTSSPVTGKLVIE